MNVILMPFAWLLKVFYNLFNNYGLALILFALVTKVALFPFALKGKRSMVKVSALTGKQQRLQKQYANNKEKYNEELQKLYEKEQVNPMSGCLWNLVPMIFLLLLYAIIREPLAHMMQATAEQIMELAKSLNWDTVAVNMGWIKQDVVEAAKEAAQKNNVAYISAFQNGGYNQLYLSSLINGGNLAAVQSIIPKAFAINFDFLGMNLAQQPQWRIWEQSLTWNNVGLFLMPIVSAGVSLVFSIVMNKTNNMNNPDAPRQGTFMTYVFSPMMALLIGYWMPAGLCVYWIANSLFSMVQELIAARMLKKDYAAAAEARRQQEILEKEEEKRLKEELRQERAKRAAEKKKGGKKKKEPKETTPGVDVTASRVGMRAYARGRAYDPDRYGGVTPYKDPDVVDEEAIEAALEAKAEKAEEAQMEAEITAKVAAEVEAEFKEGKLHEKTPEEIAAETEAEADALAESLTQAEEKLDDAWEEVTGEAAAEEDSQGEAPKEE